ncbi:MAG: SelB C-terminal domain-containing protein, partial [Gemmatimonadales bacterium]
AGVLRYLLRRGDFVRIGGDRYLLRTSLETMARRVAVHLAEAGRAKPGELRGVLGLSRKYLIPVLEWLDEARITARDGDYRITGPKAANWMGNPIDKA